MDSAQIASTCPECGKLNTETEHCPHFVKIGKIGKSVYIQFSLEGEWTLRKKPSQT